MEDGYKTLNSPAKGIYREKGSRFIALGFPVHHEQEAREILDRLKREYHDARHQCYAYRIWEEEEVVRHGDDGEPAGTGGKPIFQALLAAEITNVLVVVVRYFGGVLLGRNRLANAYRSAATDMFSHAEIIAYYREHSFRIRFPYKQMNDVMKILKDEDIHPVRPLFENTCSMFVNIRESRTDLVLKRFEIVKGLDISPVKDIPLVSEDMQNNT